MDPVLTILGGSSPFTVSLVDALAEAKLPPQTLRLLGRNCRNLNAVANYARYHLKDWAVERYTDLEPALTNSQIVLNQIRYGGMHGRAIDENLAHEFHAPADETLGPGALHRAIQLIPHLDHLASAYRRCCPDAWLLNLTNPLTVAVARLRMQGVEKCIGLCELPRVTVQIAAKMLGLDSEKASWRYAGFNHRGFIVGLTWDNIDHTQALARNLRGKTLAGVSAETISTLGVIPTKYFAYYQNLGGTKSVGRAKFLDELRERVLGQLEADPSRSPPALSERYLLWYSQSVVPLLKSLHSDTESLQVVNTYMDDGLVREGCALVSRKGIAPILPAPVQGPAWEWLNQIEIHERAVMDVVARPNLETITLALEADPLLPPQYVVPCANRINTLVGKIVISL